LIKIMVKSPSINKGINLAGSFGLWLRYSVAWAMHLPRAPDKNLPRHFL
jgi:hypothetical protein